MTDNPVKVIFGVLTTYERNGWPHPSILQYFADLPFLLGYSYRVIPVHNFAPAAAGRNVFSKQAKDSDADWICMIDNDMAIPANLLATIKDAPAEADIVVPTFYMWDQGTLKLTLCWGMDGIAPDGVATLAPGFHELTKCGTGVIFVRPRVFQAMDYPYFRYIYNDDCGMAGTEDIQFCLKAREKGFRIYGNTAVKIGHYHSVDIGRLWDWRDSLKPGLDNSVREGVIQPIKDESGCSPDRCAEDSVPVEAT